MNIRINKDWKLTTDNRNFIIEKCRVAATDTNKQKKGDEFWSQVAFYSTLDKALEGVVKYSLLNCPATTFDEVKACLRATQDDIQAIRVTIGE